MTAPRPNSWKDLFDTKRPADATLTLRVISKGGVPLLILPQSSALAAQALALYPAQTTLARVVKSALEFALRAGLPKPFPQVSLQISRADPFVQFLAQLVDVRADALPPLAVYCGNPRAAGRRFIVLLFDTYGRPVVVVKAGLDESARQLVQNEIQFLKSVPGTLPGVPKIIDSFTSERLTALAVPYLTGDSPERSDWQQAGKLLTAWLDRGNQVGISDIPVWRALQSACGSDPQFHRLAASLEGFTFSATLFHGDFAPWNLKVSRSDGSWMAVDWERGERIGLPGWDWFHYMIQTGILVEKLPVESLLRKLEALFDAPVFREYTQASGIAGREKVLAVAYLFYCVNVLRQSEGMETAAALLSFLSERWLK